jgi:ribosome-associated protein YbcJ (S4-like RNA binding protein)
VLQRTIRATVPQQSEEEITVNQLLKKCGKIYGGHE